MPSIDARITALEIAFRELAKMLGREQLITITQLATAIEGAGQGQQSNDDTRAAIAELARRLVS